jgi:hypothetical protein
MDDGTRECYNPFMSALLEVGQKIDRGS